MNNRFDLEDRLVNFASDVILFLNTLPNDNAGKNLSDQLTRSSTSSALNYGEAQGAESVRDRIHKLSISLKELKESRVALKIINRIQYGDLDKHNFLLKEIEELIAIVATMIKNKRNH